MFLLTAANGEEVWTGQLSRVRLKQIINSRHGRLFKAGRKTSCYLEKAQALPPEFRNGVQHDDGSVKLLSGHLIVLRPSEDVAIQLEGALKD
jgi:hypothetical protein